MMKLETTLNSEPAPVFAVHFCSSPCVVPLPPLCVVSEDGQGAHSRAEA